VICSKLKKKQKACTMNKHDSKEV